MPVILATQEAEIRRITFQSQPGQIVCEILSGKNPTQKMTGRVAQGVGPEFKPQYHKKKKKERKKERKRKGNSRCGPHVKEGSLTLQLIPLHKLAHAHVNTHAGASVAKEALWHCFDRFVYLLIRWF
jgi:hypothetical protein